jgi:colanic acid biosynthesis glycosyl transferase WcaI
MRYTLIVSAVYSPEPVVSARTSAEVADELCHIGQQVTVLAPFPNRPAGKLFAGYSRKLYQRENMENGVDVVRCFATLSPDSRIVSRLLENLSFGITSSWQVLLAKRPQVIYANTWPIVATGLLFLVAALRRIPLVISVQDVYPEALIAQGHITPESLLARVMRTIDSLIARRSAHVIVISERFAEIYRDQRGVPPERLSLVPNWINGQMIAVTTDGRKFRQIKGIAETDFLLVYAGNVGVAAGVDTLLGAIRHLPAETSVRLLIAGSGSQLATCKSAAEEIGSGRIVIHSPWAVDETSAVLRAADLLVLPTQGEQSLVSVPSKLLSYMLAGRPVLAAAVPDSDLADLVAQSQCGWVVEPDRPDLLVEQIEKIRALNPVERQQKGDMGRAYVLENLTEDVCVPKVIRILESAIE